MDGFYAYLVFQIFYKARNLLNEAHQLAQIIRTTICLNKMTQVCSLNVKQEIFKLYKSFINFKSKRRSLIYRRLEIRYIDDDKKLKLFARELKNRAEKITKKHSEKAI